MALQNIGASNQDDAFYRYKMPKLITKIEGRGNGIKTNIVNMVDVAKALGRPPSYTTKYFGCELGAQSKFDEKTGTSTVNGSHDNAKMVALIENFIKKYVQCYGCGNPETEILISKSQMISMRCAACGYISEVDMRDKLTTFILKNPPEVNKGGKNKKLRRAEKERLKQGEVLDVEQKKTKKESQKKKSHDTSLKYSKKKSSDEEDQSPPGSQAGDDDDAHDDEDDGVQWQTDTSAEAAKQRIKEQLTLATSEMVMLHIPDEVTEKSSKNKDAEKTAFKDSVAEDKKNSDEEKADVEADKQLGVQEKLIIDLSEFLLKGNSASQLVEYMQFLTGSSHEKMTALFEALFKGVGKGFSKEVGKKKSYLARAVDSEGSQMLLLHALEAFCKHACADAIKEVALALKVLYDEDILEESVILKWFDNRSLDSESKNSPIWKKVKPFVEWLRNAEAESEED